MRLATTLVLSTLSAFHLAAAMARNGHSTHHPSIALRQHHEPRTFLDVCAYIDVDLLGDISILGLSLGTLGRIDVCLCLSALPLYLSTNVNVLAIIEILGKNEVAALIEALINTDPTSKQCSYPLHSEPICSLEDVCGFTCDPPFTRVGRECVCESPNMECNGKCGLFHGCGSAVPRSLAEPRAVSRIRSVHAINQHSQAQQTCRFGEQVCGTYDGPRGFECLNVKTNLESCGGCVIPNPFVTDITQTRGIDCSSLPGVDEVACSSGVCVVHRCKDGWTVSKQGDTCEQITPKSNANLDLVIQTGQGATMARWRSLKRMKKGRATSGTLDSTHDLLASDTAGSFDSDRTG